jgi:DNA-binding NarL/FixJ family response regulator
MKTLLIDGHALFREGLRHILQQLPGGVDEILEAGSFPEGLKLAEQHPDLNLVLLELESPGSEGAISVRLFRQQYPHIPVVVVSSEEDCHIIKELLIYGARGFVCKSSTESTLLSALNLVLAGNVYVPPQVLQHPAMVVENKNNYSIGRNSKFKEYGLTARQMQVLKCLAEGLSNREISGAINLAEGTVKVHVAAVYQALGIRKRKEAVQVAKRLGFVSMPLNGVVSS